MIYEMTTQVRVLNFEEGKKFYQTLLNKEPDFIPHEGFAEWELIPGCWLQVAEGTPSENSGPLRLGVSSIEAERTRMIKYSILSSLTFTLEKKCLLSGQHLLIPGEIIWVSLNT